MLKCLKAHSADSEFLLLRAVAPEFNPGMRRYTPLRSIFVAPIRYVAFRKSPITLTPNPPLRKTDRLSMGRSNGFLRTYLNNLVLNWAFAVFLPADARRHAHDGAARKCHLPEHIRNICKRARI